MAFWDKYSSHLCHSGLWTRTQIVPSFLLMGTHRVILKLIYFSSPTPANVEALGIPEASSMFSHVVLFLSYPLPLSSLHTPRPPTTRRKYVGSHCFRHSGRQCCFEVQCCPGGSSKGQILLFLSLPWCPEHAVFPCKNVSLLQLDESGLLDPKRTLD